MTKAAEIKERKPIRHIAFIMDGNGRWAKKRGLPREQGHQFGVKAFRRVLEHCRERGIPVVTVYAFSTENWKRPEKEVRSIIRLMDRYLSDFEKNMEAFLNGTYQGALEAANIAHFETLLPDEPDWK